MTEHVEFSLDRRTAIVTGRERIQVSFWQKFNPIWWFLNFEEPDPPDWYLPERTTAWWRLLSWYLRNPFQNFGRYVLGVCDQNYIVRGSAPVWATTYLDDDPNHSGGWKFSIIYLGWLRLPFVSFENARICFYAGWQHWGFFGAKFNIKQSPFNFW